MNLFSLIIPFIFIAPGACQTGTISRMIKKHGEGNIKCNIEATVSFPPSDSSSTKGYHSDKIILYKENEVEECSSENPETSWGCNHEGDAGYSNFPEFDEYYSTTEMIKLSAAEPGNFTLTMHHYYWDVYEAYYKQGSQDYMIASTLDIEIQGEHKGSFQHETSEGVHTHNEDLTLNKDYKGSVDIDISCDSNCDCSIHKSDSYHSSYFYYYYPFERVTNVPTMSPAPSSSLKPSTMPTKYVRGKATQESSTDVLQHKFAFFGSIIGAVAIMYA